MTILFLYNEAINPLTGGVERTTFLLANYLESKGYNIFFLSLTNSHSIDDKRQFFLPDSSSVSSLNNVSFYRSFLVQKSINLVINKGGTNPALTKLAFHCKHEKVKLISVIHNSVLGGIKNFSSAHKTSFEKKGLGYLLPLTDTYFIKFFILYLYKLKYKKHYKSICKESEYVILESEKQKEELAFFMDGRNMDNVLGIPNFIILDKFPSYQKKKEILYVGRINTSQKRVDLLLKIWALLHNDFPEWNLKVVGGGEELESIKLLSKELKLKHIFFYGYKDAKPFYETASIICLTSSYEGFGITLIEAMQYGVVPLAFNSYISVTDIIDNNLNGYLVSPFDIIEYAQKLSFLMTSEFELDLFSIAAKQKAKLFDIVSIGERWDKIFQELKLQ
jgi:glycosyltransferase involved in cell wall biosynthesis